MKPNTYDVPAYRFALVKFKNDMLRYTTDIKEICNALRMNSNDFFLIPFEQVDGLTGNEVKDLLNQNYSTVMLICYNYCSNENESPKQLYINIILTVGPILLDDAKPIDKQFEEVMIANYDKSLNYSKAIRCFLERYQYSNREDVDLALRRTKK